MIKKNNELKQRKMIALAIVMLITSLVITSPVLGANTTNSITYDANGNRITGFNFYYEYNNFNQLVRVRQDNSTGNIIEEYVYDESGNRIYKKMGNESTFYINENLIRVINSSGSFDTIYYYDERDLVARKDPNGQKFFYHPDHLGSTAIITNETGSVVEETVYEPFGSVFTGGTDRYLYTGKELDRGTGLEYYGARYYDPEYAQFTQADSNLPDVYDPQQLNRYSYARNNPYKYTDPTGNIAWVPFAVGGIIGLFEFGYQYGQTGDFGYAASQGFITGATTTASLLVPIGGAVSGTIRVVNTGTKAAGALFTLGATESVARQTIEKGGFSSIDSGKAIFSGGVNVLGGKLLSTAGVPGIISRPGGSFYPSNSLGPRMLSQFRSDLSTEGFELGINRFTDYLFTQNNQFLQQNAYSSRNTQQTSSSASSASSDGGGYSGGTTPRLFTPLPPTYTPRSGCEVIVSCG